MRANFAVLVAVLILHSPNIFRRPIILYIDGETEALTGGSVPMVSQTVTGSTGGANVDGVVWTPPSPPISYEGSGGQCLGGPRCGAGAAAGHGVDDDKDTHLGPRSSHG